MKRFMSKKEVRAIVLYSYAHIDRLEKAGEFPLRAKLGNNRVGWAADEIEAWVQRKLDERFADRSE